MYSSHIFSKSYELRVKVQRQVEFFGGELQSKIKKYGQVPIAQAFIDETFIK